MSKVPLQDIAILKAVCRVPAAFMRGPVFACGEPWRHNERGHSVYLCFRHKRGDPFEARYASVKELVAEIFPKAEPDILPAG